MIKSEKILCELAFPCFAIFQLPPKSCSCAEGPWKLSTSETGPLKMVLTTQYPFRLVHSLFHGQFTNSEIKWVLFEITEPSLSLRIVVAVKKDPENSQLQTYENGPNHAVPLATGPQPASWSIHKQWNLVSPLWSHSAFSFPEVHSGPATSFSSSSCHFNLAFSNVH